MEYLESLNPQQRQAVEHTQGPLLVVAGAGSGKTRVLTYRIAHMIHSHHIEPYRILAVTFTNKAAQEMKERVRAIVGPQADEVWVSTFHSSCVQILRREAHHLGYQRNFLIFDSSDQKVVMRDCLKELNLDPKKFEPRAIMAGISGAKNELLSPEAFDAQAADFWQNTVARVYKKYQAKLAENNAMDFDDLIINTVALWQQFPDILRKYQERFQYVLVDEYQDTNHAQYVLVNLLAQGHRNLCVVGDEDQSIYGFRGADIRNILDFEEDYPEAVVVKLEENYRSSQTILEAANTLIANNTQRKEKALWTQSDQGPNLAFFQGRDEREEAAYVADVIAADVKERQRSLTDFTILYRTHAQSRNFEDAFMRRGIAYRIVSGLRFYERKEIKDFMAYLRLLHNPMDNYSFRRIVNVPRRGIGDVTVAKVEEFALSQGLSLYEALEALDNVPGLAARFRKGLGEFFTMMEDLRAEAASTDLTTLAEMVLQRTGYEKALTDEKTLEAETRWENVKEFLSVTRQFEKEHPGSELGDFLEHVALISDADAYEPGAAVVSMMTFHAAKGLEFPVVFMVGLEDGIFPHSRSLYEPEQMEEERRLAYVGITRAQEELYLTCAQMRTIFGQQGYNPVSQFVDEIPAELVDDRTLLGMPSQVGVHASSNGRVSAQGCQASAAQAPSAGTVGEWKVGDKIRHPKWGDGMIVSTQGDKSGLILSLSFPDQGIKKVMADLAPIEKR